MRIFPPAPDIGETEGFDPSKDIFGREKFGAGLTNLVQSVPDPMVIAVDGQWGSGKTTFLKMWAGELRKIGCPVVFFDAFENDYLEDAFTAIASEIIALAQNLNKADTPAANKFLNTAVSAGKVILRSGLKMGVKAGTAGLLDAEDLKDLSGDIAKEASTLADKYIGELLTTKNEQKDAIRGFRAALGALPDLLAEKAPKAEKEKQEGDTRNSKPLIFIIDELDRCRPGFALQILERVKHFFNVPNVHFVLGTHLEQLRNAVIVAYGPDIDADTYLQKFISLRFVLVDYARFRNERTNVKFMEYLVKTMEFRSEDHEAVDSSASFIINVAEHQELSLRTIEQIMSVLALALAYSSNNQLRLPAVLAGLSVLKVVAPNLYAKAKRGTLKFPDVKEILGLQLNENDEEDSGDSWSTNWWRFCADENVDEEFLLSRRQLLVTYNIDDRFHIVPHLANNVIDRLVSV
ncbi:MAG: hypothetical protein HOM58_04580 [Rhodospirillaceae bacterium]|jgi:hypothetical protein|nr:hypothetical protein [Rhodospirillaceae bacterium]MBT5459768.1 hypothetical protein [Rhodospirillaceae bacterium]MBT7770936.1 hypothetical protein [Rhodospirillales bacterium]